MMMMRQEAKETAKTFPLSVCVTLAYSCCCYCCLLLVCVSVSWFAIENRNSLRASAFLFWLDPPPPTYIGSSRNSDDEDDELKLYIWIIWNKPFSTLPPQCFGSRREKGITIVLYHSVAGWPPATQFNSMIIWMTRLISQTSRNENDNHNHHSWMPLYLFPVVCVAILFFRFRL